MTSEYEEKRLALVQGIQSALSESTAPEALPTDAAVIRDIEAKPHAMRTQEDIAALDGAQRRAMADLLRKPNSQVTVEEAASIRAGALAWMQKGDE